MTERTLLVFGLGYSALAIAQRLRSEGWRGIGTTRDPEKARTLEEVRLEMRVWPGDDLTADIAAADHLLVSAAPGPEGDPFLTAYGEALQHASFRWIGYLSTTGVYGDRGGAAVDEGELKKSLIDTVRSQVGPIATPRDIHIVTRLPKTRSGKILRGTMQKIADGKP